MLLLEKLRGAYQSGGLSRVEKQALSFARRRYFAARSRFENMAAEVSVPDPPKQLVAGCMYKVRCLVRNKSKSVWNSTSRREPSYAVAAIISDHSGVDIEGPHTRLPADFKPLEERQVDVIFEVPRKPGTYQVRIDLVRENCYWFSDIGNSQLTLPLEVCPHSALLLQSQIPALDVTLDITNKCPLKCIQCRKTYFETFDEQQDMSFDLLRKIAAELFPHSRAVSLSSAGEPLMARYFLDAIRLTRDYGVQEISFISAGLHLNPARTEKALDLGVTRIEFSLDGASAEVYNRIRIGSNFDKVIRNISYLVELKKKRKSRIPLLRFNFVLMKSNIHELPAFIDLAAKLGVEEVQTQHMIVFSKVVQEETLLLDKEKSNRFIEKAIARARYHGIRFFHPPLFDLSPETDGPQAKMHTISDGKIWIEEDRYDFERKTHPVIRDGMQLCTDPWRKFYIDWLGFVYPCCVWKEPPLGDLKTTGFSEIWKSYKYASLRESLMNGKLGKSCAECSAITGGDINLERSYFY